MKDIVVPELAESIFDGTIIAWLKDIGDPVEESEPVAELETDKINVEIPATASGVLAEQSVEVGDDVEVGAVIGKIDPEGEASATSEEPEEQPEEEQAAEGQEEPTPEQEETPAPAASSSSSTVLDTPSARKHARETGESTTVEEPQAQETKSDTFKPAATLEKPSEEEESTPDKPVEVVEMSRRRQAIARNLVEAQQTTAMLTTFNEVDMSAIMNLRKEVQDEFVERHDIKLGFMSIFSKAVISGLKKYPDVNAEITDKKIIRKKYYNVGIAVGAEEGLVVPVVKNADRMNFAEIEHEIKGLANKANDNTLTLSDMQDGTFTITNGGVFGSLFSTPIINMPQVGILGMHGIFDRPITLEDGSIENRPMMYIALSYDHRVIDGSTSVKFLKHVKDLLEDPKKLLLEG